MTEFTHQLDATRKGNETLRVRLMYYENSNTPTYSRSLEYLEEKSKICKVKKRLIVAIKKNQAIV